MNGRLDLHQLNGVAWQQVTLWHPKTVLIAQVGSALFVHRVLILRTEQLTQGPIQTEVVLIGVQGSASTQRYLRCSKVCSALRRPLQGNSYGEGWPTSPDPRPPRR